MTDETNGAAVAAPFEGAPLEDEAGAVEIAELMRLGRDRPRPAALKTTARVFLPGLPNRRDGYGVWGTVKALDEMGQGRLMSRIRDSYTNNKVTVPGYEDMSDSERWIFWTKVHRLMLCTTTPRIGLESAIILLTTNAGNGVTGPLLNAIEKLTLAPPQVDDVQLDRDDIAMYPAITAMWMAAARDNRLVEFMAGDPNITEPIRRWVKTITATQALVLEEQARAIAQATGKAVGEALTPQFRELGNLLLCVNGIDPREYRADQDAAESSGNAEDTGASAG